MLEQTAEETAAFARVDMNNPATRAEFDLYFAVKYYRGDPETLADHARDALNVLDTAAPRKAREWRALLERHAPGVVPTANPLRAQLMTVSALATRKPGSPLIADTLAEYTTNLLVGASNTGKSFVGLDWACSIATGTPWNGREVKPGRVLYIAAESEETIVPRVRAWEAARRVYVGDRLMILAAAPQFGQPDEVAQLLDVCRDEWRLIIVDTLSKVTAGVDENDNSSMRDALNVADKAREAANGTALVIHHAGKDASKGARGASALKANVATEYATEGGGDTGRVVLTRTKRKDGPVHDVHHFELQAVGDSAVLAASPDDTLPLIPRRDKDAEALELLAGGPLKDGGSVSRADAVAYLEHAAGMSDSTAKRRVRALIDAGRLVLADDGNLSLAVAG